jgi:uncharacterized protein (DUF1810 family)
MPTTADPFDLQRFVMAQAPIYAQALDELRAGLKRTHWSWYVLPQLSGLGASSMSRRYAISGLAEARAYLEHPVLGPRLVECIEAMNSHQGDDAAVVLGEVDARKFHSCVCLFALVDARQTVFSAAIAKYFGGRRDSATDKLLTR